MTSNVSRPASFKPRWRCPACGDTNTVLSIGTVPYCLPCLVVFLDRNPGPVVSRLPIPAAVGGAA